MKDNYDKNKPSNDLRKLLKRRRKDLGYNKNKADDTEPRFHQSIQCISEYGDHLKEIFESIQRHQIVDSIIDGDTPKDISEYLDIYNSNFTDQKIVNKVDSEIEESILKSTPKQMWNHIRGGLQYHGYQNAPRIRPWSPGDYM